MSVEHSFHDWTSHLSTEPLRVIAKRLDEGLHDEVDTITWRTMAINMRAILGSPSAETLPATAPMKEARQFVEDITTGTYFHKLTPEILYALGYTEIEAESDSHLDTLIINARHSTEGIVWKLADNLSQQGEEVAVINPVGHYSDHEPRILGPRVLLHEVDTALVLTSTQFNQGGSMSVLVETLNLLRNPLFSSHIRRVAVVIPMLGGSRGHKMGQAQEIGYEVLQATSIPTRLSLVANDIQLELGENAPQVTFYSVDIHNLEMPQVAFEQKGYEFISIGPERVFARAIKREIYEQNLKGVPIRLIAVDKGAAARTDALAAEILLDGANGQSFVDIIEIKKTRNTSGVVDSASVDRIVRMEIQDGEIKRTIIDIENYNYEESFIRVTSDDILDSGRSAKKDDELLARIMPNSILKISVVTHAVMSETIRSAIDNTGSDVVIIGNTLTNPLFLGDSRIRIVDVSPAISQKVKGRKD